VKVADDMIADHRPVRLLNIELEDARALVIDPDDGVIMIDHRALPARNGDPTAPGEAAL
jgi:hypothetical protein